MNSEYQSTNLDNGFECSISILVEPIDVTTSEGAYVNLSAVIRAHKPTFQWYDKDGKAIENQHQNNLLIGPISHRDFGFYRLSIIDEATKQKTLTRWVEVKNSNPQFDNQTTNPQTYTENRAPPKVIVQVQSGVFRKGDTVFLTAHFENAGYYQWYKDGMMLEGCTGNTLLITEAVTANTGSYTLLAANEHNLINQTRANIVIN